MRGVSIKYNHLAISKEVLTLAREWHPTKNGSLTINDIAPHGDKEVWWLCKRGHEWKASIYDRRKDVDCPYCSRKK